MADKIKTTPVKVTGTRKVQSSSAANNMNYTQTAAYWKALQKQKAGASQSERKKRNDQLMGVVSPFTKIGKRKPKK